MAWALREVRLPLSYSIPVLQEKIPVREGETLCLKKNNAAQG